MRLEFLRKLFKKKEEPKKKWGVIEEDSKDVVQVQVEKPKSKFKVSLPRPKLVNPFKKKYRIGWMLKSKRVLTGFLFLAYSATFITNYSHPASIVFFLTAFILLDYLWKTRKSKIIFKEPGA